MKITSKGQVTIPQEMRERYGLHPQTEVEFATGESGVVIRPARTRKARFRDWITKARGSATVQIMTDEVMRLTRGEDWAGPQKIWSGRWCRAGNQPPDLCGAGGRLREGGGAGGGARSR